jgi:hypothetical protein
MPVCRACHTVALAFGQEGSEAMTDTLALPLDLPEPDRRCWYCGTTSALVFEREHQRPISRGGVPSGPTVDSCQQHNRLKGDRTMPEFRAALAERLGVDPETVVFAGEATPQRPATNLDDVRSLVDDRDGVRLYHDVGRSLRRAVLMLRGRGLPRVSLTSLASRYVAEGIARDAERFSGDRLFDVAGDEEWELPPVEPEAELPLDPAKVPIARRVVRIDSRLHESLIATVLFLRTQDRPHMSLVDAVDEAAADWVLTIEDGYNDGKPLPPVSSYDEAELRALRVSLDRQDSAVPPS